jgi:hypothetical protein
MNDVTFDFPKPEPKIKNDWKPWVWFCWTVGLSPLLAIFYWLLASIFPTVLIQPNPNAVEIFPSMIALMPVFGWTVTIPLAICLFIIGRIAYKLFH